MGINLSHREGFEYESMLGFLDLARCDIIGSFKRDFQTRAAPFAPYPKRSAVACEEWRPQNMRRVQSRSMRRQGPVEVRGQASQLAVCQPCMQSPHYQKA